MKPFPPTIREKSRYIRFQVVGEKSEKVVRQALNNSVMQLFGEDGYSRSGCAIISYEKGVGVMRCTHEWLDNVLVALTFVTKIGSKQGKVEVLAVSGTIKGLD